jgi:hypothetical protein
MVFLFIKYFGWLVTRILKYYDHLANEYETRIYISNFPVSSATIGE